MQDHNKFEIGNLHITKRIDGSHVIDIFKDDKLHKTNLTKEQTNKLIEFLSDLFKEHE